MAASRERNLFLKARFRFNWIDTRSRNDCCFWFDTRWLEPTYFFPSTFFSFFFFVFSRFFSFLCFGRTIGHSIKQVCNVRSCTLREIARYGEIRTKHDLVERKTRSGIKIRSPPFSTWNVWYVEFYQRLRERKANENETLAEGKLGGGKTKKKKKKRG